MRFAHPLLLDLGLALAALVVAVGLDVARVTLVADFLVLVLEGVGVVEQRTLPDDVLVVQRVRVNGFLTGGLVPAVIDTRRLTRGRLRARLVDLASQRDGLSRPLARRLAPLLRGGFSRLLA